MAIALAQPGVEKSAMKDCRSGWRSAYCATKVVRRRAAMLRRTAPCTEK